MRSKYTSSLYINYCVKLITIKQSTPTTLFLCTNNIVPCLTLRKIVYVNIRCYIETSFIAKRYKITQRVKKWFTYLSYCLSVVLSTINYVLMCRDFFDLSRLVLTGIWNITVVCIYISKYVFVLITSIFVSITLHLLHLNVLIHVHGTKMPKLLELTSFF